MANVNKVILIGNVTRDPEVKFTSKGSAVADLGLAINRNYTLDNGGVPGDTIMQLTPEIATGPTSTFIGGSILNWLMLGTMEWLKANHHAIPVLRSQNIPGAIDHNRAVGAKYQHRLSKQLA